MHDYWRHPEFDRLALEARFSAAEGLRGDAYRRMTAIFLEQNPWIVVIQPFEDYGIRRYVEFTPNPTSSLSCGASTSVSAEPEPSGVAREVNPQSGSHGRGPLSGLKLHLLVPPDLSSPTPLPIR